MLNNVKIAIDAMGSDHGPKAIVSGAALSKKRNPGSQYIFFGVRFSLVFARLVRSALK